MRTVKQKPFLFILVSLLHTAQERRFFSYMLPVILELGKVPSENELTTGIIVSNLVFFLFYD